MIERVPLKGFMVWNAGIALLSMLSACFFIILFLIMDAPLLALGAIGLYILIWILLTAALILDYVKSIYRYLEKKETGG